MTENQRESLVILNWRDWFHPKSGGAEFFLRDLSHQLAERFHRIYVVSPEYEECGPFPEGGRVVALRTGNSLTVYVRASQVAKRLSRSGESFRILESVNTIPFLARLYSQPLPVVLVHHMAGRELFSEVPFPGSLILFAIERLMRCWVNGCHVVTISNQSRNELLGVGLPSDRVHVVHPGMDTNALPDSVMPADARGHTLAYIGPLKRYKGVEDVLRAFSLVRLEFPDVHLDIGGRGYLEGHLRQMALRLGVGPHVTFHGFLSENEKLLRLNSTSLFVYPSLSEGGWSLSVLEAMAMGAVPIVSTAVQEMAEEGRGYVVPFHSPPSILNAIRSHWSETQRQLDLSDKALRYARQFTIQRSASEILKLVTGM